MTTMTNNIHTKEVTQFTESDAMELALLIERQEKALSIMKDKLKSYVKLNGGIQTNDKVWDFVPAFKWDFTPENYAELAGAIASEGKNPYHYFKLGATEIKKMMDKEGIDENFLSQFGNKVPTNPTFKSVAKK